MKKSRNECDSVIDAHLYQPLAGEAAASANEAAAAFDKAYAKSNIDEAEKQLRILLRAVGRLGSTVALNWNDEGDAQGAFYRSWKKAAADRAKMLSAMFSWGAK
jgi:hypothetical protein